jgi:hypothetical protein
MKHPDLRSGDPASLLDLPKMVPDRSVDQPELLQHVERQPFMSLVVARTGWQFPARDGGSQVSLSRYMQL